MAESCEPARPKAVARWNTGSTGPSRVVCREVWSATIFSRHRQEAEVERRRIFPRSRFSRSRPVLLAAVLSNRLSERIRIPDAGALPHRGGRGIRGLPRSRHGLPPGRRGHRDARARVHPVRRRNPDRLEAVPSRRRGSHLARRRGDRGHGRRPRGACASRVRFRLANRAPARRGALAHRSRRRLLGSRKARDRGTHRDHPARASPAPTTRSASRSW